MVTYASCQSGVLRPEEMARLVGELAPHKSRSVDCYMSPPELVSVLLASDHLESLDQFIVHPRVGVECRFTLTGNGDGVAHKVLTRVAGLVNFVDMRTFCMVEAGGSGGDRLLEYELSVSCQRTASQAGTGECDKDYRAAVAFLCAPADMDPEVKSQAIIDVFHRALGAMGVAGDTELKEVDGKYEVCRRGSLHFEKEPISPTCLALVRLPSLDEAMTRQQSALAQLARSLDETEFYCSMTLDEYKWFREEFRDEVRPWRIGFYGQLHDWVRPFAPLDDLPPDAPAEVPIYQKWDGNLKNFEIGRILRTPEGLRLLVTTNKSSARNLRTRLKKATGLDFEAIEPEGAGE